MPDSLRLCHLVASGGIAAEALSCHDRMSRPTEITPVGLVARLPGRDAINLADVAMADALPPEPRQIPTIAVAGTAMNAGKTTTAAYLIRGLKLAGLRVGYAKVTGTGAGGDPGLVADAGADVTLDFTDVGYATTYRITPQAVEDITVRLLGHLHAAGVEAIALEIADGLYQQETAHLLRSEVSRQFFDGVLFAAADAMGAVAGCDWLRAAGQHVLGVTGVLTTAPLQVREAEAMTRHRVYPTHGLASAGRATELLELCRNAR